jgi:hypothetical protein
MKISIAVHVGMAAKCAKMVRIDKQQETPQINEMYASVTFLTMFSFTHLDTFFMDSPIDKMGQLISTQDSSNDEVVLLEATLCAYFKFEV